MSQKKLRIAEGDRRGIVRGLAGVPARSGAVYQRRTVMVVMGQVRIVLSVVWARFLVDETRNRVENVLVCNTKQGLLEPW